MEAGKENGEEEEVEEDGGPSKKNFEATSEEED